MRCRLFCSSGLFFLTFYSSFDFFPSFVAYTHCCCVPRVMQLPLLGHPADLAPTLAELAADNCLEGAADGGASGFVTQDDFVSWFSRVLVTSPSRKTGGGGVQNPPPAGFRQPAPHAARALTPALVVELTTLPEEDAAVLASRVQDAQDSAGLVSRDAFLRTMRPYVRSALSNPDAASSDALLRRAHELFTELFSLFSLRPAADGERAPSSTHADAVDLAVGTSLLCGLPVSPLDRVDLTFELVDSNGERRSSRFCMLRCCCFMSLRFFPQEMGVSLARKLSATSSWLTVCSITWTPMHPSGPQLLRQGQGPLRVQKMPCQLRIRSCCAAAASIRSARHRCSDFICIFCCRLAQRAHSCDPPRAGCHSYNSAPV
jgi:hypothetical protein